jgi:pimeloyl-ACP methyl ester carboxylesterase
VSIVSGEFRFDLGPEAKATMVLCHGFTSDPASILPWGEHLRDAGFNVIAPLLPGHGDTWQVLAKATWQQWRWGCRCSRAGFRWADRCRCGWPSSAAGTSRGWCW